MSEQRKEEEDVEDEVGSNGHSPRLSTAVEADISKKIPNQSRRRASSSRSSSKVDLSVRSWPQGFDLRRAFLIGRRGSPSTPVPSWKVSDNSIHDASLERHHQRHLKHDHAAQQGLRISARKLAASLWELQRLPFSEATRIEENLGQESQQRNNNASPTKQTSTLHGQHLSPASSHISKRSHKRSPVHMKFGDNGKIYETHKGQHVMPVTTASMRKSSLHDQIIGDGSTTSPSKSMVLSSKDALSKLGCGPLTTSEFLKVLNHVWSLEEQHASSMSLVGALRNELEEAQAQLQELLLNEESHRKEVENVSKRIAEERAMWQDQHEQTVRIAAQSVRQELENERKSKQKLEMLHKKMVREFRDVKRTVARVFEDFERERKARQLMEEVCDELAREIGQDKARVEELKRESVKVREEVEEERKMLQMAEVWREERVQMKLMEAKLELEEKNTTLDKIRSQLEDFLVTKRAGDVKDGGDHATSDTRVDAGRCSVVSIVGGNRSVKPVVGRNLLDPFHLTEQRGVDLGVNSVDSGHGGRRLKPRSAWMSDSDDDDDDLHSIELNHEPLVRTASNEWGSHTFRQNETEYEEIRLSDEKIERSRNNQMDREERNDVKAEEVVPAAGVSQGFQRIGHYDEGSEIRKWRQGALHEGRRESVKSWQSDTEDSQSQISSSPKVIASSIQGQSESIMRAARGGSNLVYEQASRSGEWQQQIANYGRWQPNMIDGPANYASNTVSSPTRKWNSHMPSPDLRSKASNEALYGSSLKTKHLEAKLEGQQAVGAPRSGAERREPVREGSKTF